MSSDVPAPQFQPDPQQLRADAQRWVRRLRILYTILGIYAALGLMWFAIDTADGTENLWFYWPMLGVGLAVAVTAIVLVGIGGLFGTDWENRKMERYLHRAGGTAPTIDENSRRERPQGGQTMKIGIVDVFVDDQDRARQFYTATLGLEIKDDAFYGEGGRWVTVVSPQARDGTALLLATLNDAAKVLQAARRDSGTPAVSFTTDDCERSYRELLERGVVFVSEPRAMGYGGIDAVFEDGCGNLLNLHQDTPAATGA
jgi:predicted enzyme related to lactoylglutathione lyase